MKVASIYILTNKRNGTLYIGITSDLIKRIYQHKNGCVDSFSKKYNTHILVYYEQYMDMYEAIAREKQLKKWNRSWKLQLIDEFNPHWVDLYDEIIK
jgi:putative endonuclease